MKTLVSALLLLGFLSACEQLGMNNHAMDDGMAMAGAPAMGDETMGDGMGAMAGG